MRAAAVFRTERLPSARFVVAIVALGIVALAWSVLCVSSPTAADGNRHRILTISAICLLDDELHRNRSAVLDMIGEAGSRQQHDLIVAPLTPFLSFREGQESENLRDFVELARRLRTFVSIALMEESLDGRTFCTSLLIGRQGQIVGKYRQTHGLPDDAMALGDDLPVFKTEIGTIGLTLGSDFYFPEAYTVEWLKGSEIIIWQSAPERFRDYATWLPLLKARAQDTHSHFVAAMYADPRTYVTNRYPDMPGAAWGRSMILNRVGVPIADTGHDDGIATAVVNLDKRKINVWSPFYAAESMYFVNNLGDRTAFTPLTKAWEKPRTPVYKKRQARIAVAHGPTWPRDEHAEPTGMLRILDDALQSRPDLVLLTEMHARNVDLATNKTARMVADRARKAHAYILIGGLDDSGERSHAWLWDRDGRVVFKQPIYWTEGFPEIKVYDTDFARIGIHECGDLYTGEIDRVLALQGAEIIFDPSMMVGADGYNNQLMLQARAADNGSWIACAHYNSSDSGMRSLAVDPYGSVIAASRFQHDGSFAFDVDFDQQRVYYAGRRAEQAQRGSNDYAAYYTGDVPEQRFGWREMIFPRRRPELYGIIPTTNDVTQIYRPPEPVMQQ